ncbi:MAG: LytR C-terminal domain-containing protein [Patescibacteria group bacterium]|nr:LytR C-terminal domain-containing protein [Patescibacteria group bacterium]
MPAKKESSNLLPIVDKKDRGKAKLWQKDQQKKHWRRNLFRFGWLIALLVVGTLIWQVISFKNFLERPFQKLPGEISYRTNINFNSRVNLLLLSLSYDNKVKSLVIASYDGLNKGLDLFPIPSEVYLDAPHSLGPVTIASLYNRGNFQGNQGVKYLLKGVEEVLAIPLDGYLGVVNFSDDELENVLSESSIKEADESLKDIFFFFNFLNYKSWGEKHLKTNLSLTNLIDLTWKVREVRYDRFKYYQTQDLFLKKTTGANVEERVLDDIKADPLLDTIFNDPVVVEERLTVEVKNGTEKSGLGGEAARFITRLGAKVNHVGNADSKVKETLIYDYQGENQTVLRIRDALGVGKIVRQKSEVVSKEDIQVILGEDYQKSL